MDNLTSKVDELADLMDKFQLSQAELSGDDWRIAFKKRSVAKSAPAAMEAAEPQDYEDAHAEMPAASAPAVPQGTPVASPMTGIYYTASSPSAPPFVKEGEPVSAGQVVGLIEAMKVFNEIVAPTSGRVTKLLASNAQLVNPGDVLLYIG